MDALLEVVEEHVVTMDCEEAISSPGKAPKSAGEPLTANSTEVLKTVELTDPTNMDKLSSLGSKETVSSWKKATENAQEPLIADSTEVVEVVESMVQTNMDKSSSSNESDGAQHSTEVSAMETDSEPTSHPMEVSSLNMKTENIKMKFSIQVEESKAQTPVPRLLTEVNDESNLETEKRSSDTELKEAPSAPVQESGDKTASQSQTIDTTNTTTPKTDASNGSVVIDPNAEVSKPASSTDSNPKTPGPIENQTLKPKSKAKTTKIVSLSKLGPNGKPLNIKIISNRKKTSVNVNVPSVVKPVSTPKELASKKLPLLLPKISPSPITVSSTVPTTSTPSANLDEGVAPQNYLLIQTPDGVSFLPIEQMMNGAITTSGAENVPTVSGPQNISICKTSNSSNLGVVNASTTPKTSTSKMSLSSQLKIPPPQFSTSPCNAASPSVLSTVKVAGQATKTEHPAFVGLCKHPTCSTYRGKVMEELHVKEKRRNRKLKTIRVAKERSVRRAATLIRQVKNLERQRAVISELELFPDEMCKTLMKAQLKPCEGVKAKTLHEKELRDFATQLHLISPKAYDIVRGVFNRVLPESPSTDNWNFAAPEVPVVEKAGNSDEDEEMDSESGGDEEMSELNL